MIVIMGLFLINSCEKDSESALSDEMIEEQAIRDMAQNEDSEESDYLADWGIDDGQEQNMYDGYSTFSPGSFPKILSPIDNVLRFGRKLNRGIPRTIVLRRISPDSILLYLDRVWVGQFFIFQDLNNNDTPPDTFALYRKPLVHSVKKTAIFTKRFNDANALQDPRRRWKLSAISLGEGKSLPEATVEIHQVDINTSSGENYNFTDPSELLSIPDDLPIAMRGETVNITVLVSNATQNPVYHPENGSTETLLLHYGISRFHRARRKFEFKGVDPVSGYNLYEGEWIVHEPALRPFHAVIDVIDNGTIYDDDVETYPYNSATWGFPYRVVVSK